MCFDISANYEDLEKFFSLFPEVNLQKILTNSKIIDDFNINNIMPFIGCFKKLDDDQIVYGYNLFLPKINNIKSLLINIHEISHAITINLNLYKIDFDDPFEECVPIALERLYITKYRVEYLKNFNLEQLNRLLKMENNLEKFYKYIIAFYYQFELCQLYSNNLNEIFKHHFFNPYNLEEIYKNTLKLLTK